MPDSSPVVRRCPLCRVDVSVPGDFVDPRCPSCDAPLVASLATPDESSETLLEVRKDSALEVAIPSDSRSSRAEDATLRDIPLDRPSGSEERRATGAAATRRPAEDESLLDTATFPGQMEPGEERIVGNYRLVRILGKGGMGIVYEAVHRELARTVALKVMSIRDAGVEEIERFKREARAAAKLRHPNIVPILDVGEHEGQHFFTMDLVRGQTLTALARSHQLTPGQSAEILAKVSRAIHHAHEAGVIHRDLKPSNILLDEQGEPHVMDFGLAKDLSDVSGLTLTGVAMGSPPYMPPEQARGEFRQVDAVSDVYGLGASLYECLAGRAPFTGKSLYDIIAKVLVEDPAPPSQLRPDVPYDLETICLKALEKEKWRRYPSALDLALDLDRYSQGASIRARRQGLTTKVGRYLVRNRSVIVAVLLPLALAAALATYAFGQGASLDEPEPDAPLAAPKLGPVADAARLCGTLQLDPALTRVCGALPELPRADAVSARIAALPAAQGPGPLQQALLAAQAGGSEALGGEELAALLASLGRAPPHDISVNDLAATVSELFQPDDPWAAWLRQLVLALRARETREEEARVEAWRAAFSGPPTPFDLPLLSALAARRSESADRRFAAARDALTATATPQRALPDAPPSLTQDKRGRIVVAAPAGSAGWTYPPFALPGEKLTRPILRSRFGELGPPSPPLLAPDGRSLVVGWLRFVVRLRIRDGAVLARRRLPGLVLGVDHAPGGGVSVRVALGAESEASSVLAFDLQGELQGGRDPQAWRDQLRREAVARLPEFETLIALERLRPGAEEPAPEEGAPPPRSELRYIELRPDPAEVLDLGLQQGPPRAGAQVVLASEGLSPEELEPSRISGVSKPLFAGAQGHLLYGLRTADPFPPQRRRKRNTPFYVGRTDLALWFDPIQRRGVSYRPTRRPEEAEWKAILARCDAFVASEEGSPNPWLLAFQAAARERLGDPDPLLAGRAALSAGLDPRGRVELACFLDAHGYEQAADQGLELALVERWEQGPFLPEWAGWGELDPGRRLADWADRCGHYQQRWERADQLARWRDAFAPNLRDGRWAREALRLAGRQRSEVESAAPALPAALAQQRPRKGLAGLNVLNLARADHAIRLQPIFVGVVIGVLLLLLLRYRRHSIRDLGRLGFLSAWARLKLWWESPTVRAHYALPAYLTLPDKVALIVVYVVFLLLFALQEASVQVVLLADRPAAREMLSGDLSSGTSERHLIAKSPSREAIYALAWVRRARGEELGDLEHVLLKLGVTSARHYLLWAESQPGQRRAKALGRVEASAELEPYLELARARGEQDAAKIDAAEAKLAALDPAWAGYLWARQRLAQAKRPALPPLPAAPPPTSRDRDRLLFATEQWSRVLPYKLMLNVLGLKPTEGWEDTLDRFQLQHDTTLAMARYHNEFLFAVPVGLLLLVALLFVSSPHRFEPLESDLKPPPTIRLLRLLFPGVAQLQHQRTLRGVLLLLPFVYFAMQVLGGITSKLMLAVGQSFFGSLVTSLELAQLTGEAASALPIVRQFHLLEMALVLGFLYAAHWLDLALAQHKSYESPDEEEGRPEPRRREPEFIIPLDSEAAIASEIPRSSGTAPGPFDATEAGRAATPRAPDTRPRRARAVEGDSDELPLLPDLSDSDDDEDDDHGFAATETSLPILPELSDSDEGEPGPFDRTERDLPAPPVERTELDLRPRPDPSRGDPSRGQDNA